MTTEFILWRAIHLQGHEACRLYRLGNAWRLEGTAVFSHDSHPCHLSYLVVCDSSWNTLNARVSGWVASDNVDVELSAGPDHLWQLNGVMKSAVNGCVDLDLNFSPSTNLLPIWRLALGIGQQTEVKAAWPG